MKRISICCVVCLIIYHLASCETGFCSESVRDLPGWYTDPQVPEGKIVSVSRGEGIHEAVAGGLADISNQIDAIVSSDISFSPDSTETIFDSGSFQSSDKVISKHRFGQVEVSSLSRMINEEIDGQLNLEFEKTALIDYKIGAAIYNIKYSASEINENRETSLSYHSQNADFNDVLDELQANGVEIEIEYVGGYCYARLVFDSP